MNRKIVATAKSDGYLKDIKIEVSVKFQHLVLDEVATEVDRIRKELHAFLSSRFQYSQIKIK
jgi:hypothetical protein